MSISLAAASNGGAAAATTARTADAAGGGSQSPNAAPVPAPAGIPPATANVPSSPPISPSSSTVLGWRARLPPSVSRAFLVCDRVLQENAIVLVVLMALTLLALFIDDLRCALAPPQADTAIFITSQREHSTMAEAQRCRNLSARGLSADFCSL